MKKTFKRVALALLLAVVVFVGVVMSAFIGSPAPPDGVDVGGFARIVKDGYVTFSVLDAGKGDLVLVDTGNDSEGKSLLAELARRHVSKEAVKAIFLTHGHADHVSGVHLFPHAEVYALNTEIPYAEGKANFTSLMLRILPKKETHVKVSRGLRDGETVQVGELSIQAFAVPGHTPGSAVYRVGDVLFMGDSADATQEGHLAAAKWPVTDDTAANRESLRALVQHLGPTAETLHTLVFSHTGTLPSVKPLLDFSGPASTSQR